ncbi:MAG: MraY family glycosyltransferase [Candidatus Cloacimonadaceae bacterium]|jgi:UDP-GlcNAc:undecaprenyl-phosphate GlcNAc-1-phosphate transferase|nr:undecaprenyl/decaprenyl-phosphate alpha-N-acetylglucosaminyl 1-phosphate transferase [Candidatus Cloacimonadota bacterium]MDY0128119.1 MraY family glycosyltransferase [Candidatus Cloacimonadaceae bacterium]MCB5255046.1 undecaprenyl/decaprenyl-phosphate alpha-N-acetylglucosaminyl 1-phosphate transferase [Candidatus Cloacimonadota bacterium]MCK9178850.1 undecaprenyl/decaprenyl-phosphate alpha-N-acetylglucosaminyl 1-phosphate transferase [Candidatus Cloacimonadota bacterium]MCK9243363.1 undecap
MSWYIVAAALAIQLLTHILMPFNLRFSRLHGIIALPGERRIHEDEIPEAGGLSFGLPIILMQLIFAVVFRHTEMGRLFFELGTVGVLALTFGLLDDRFESRARHKFVWQIALGVIMYVIGYRVLFLTNPLGSHFILGWLSFPVTVLWYVIVINAINFIDGLDGLASGIAAIVSIVLLVVGIREQNFLVISLSAFLLSGTLAFLYYNFHPAKIFLGETGTQFIALNIAAISTAGAAQFKGITSMTMMIPLVALGIPLLDVLLAVFRRIRLGNIFTADKLHIHHTMLAFGLSQRTISIIVYFITLLFGLIAIGFSFTDKKVLFTLLMTLLALIVIIAYILMRRERDK